MKRFLTYSFDQSIWSKPKIKILNSYDIHTKRSGVTYITEVTQEVRTDAEPWGGEKGEGLSEEAALETRTQRHVLLLLLTSVLPHHVELLQVELLPNPRVVGEVVHDEAHHRLRICTHQHTH